MWHIESENHWNKSEGDIQDLTATGTDMGASVTESVSGGISNLQENVTQVLSIYKDINHDAHESLVTGKLQSMVCPKMKVYIQLQ